MPFVFFQSSVDIKEQETFPKISRLKQLLAALKDEDEIIKSNIAICIAFLTEKKLNAFSMQILTEIYVKVARRLYEIITDNDYNFEDNDKKYGWLFEEAVFLCQKIVNDQKASPDSDDNQRLILARELEKQYSNIYLMGEAPEELEANTTLNSSAPPSAPARMSIGQ